MPQPSWKAVLNQEAVLGLGTVPKAQGKDVTENPRRVIEEPQKKDALATKPGPP